MESHLRVASIFAQRWSTHESRDFSKQRFEKFASVLIEELPGFHAVELIPPDSQSGWAVPNGAKGSEALDQPERQRVLKEAVRSGQAVLSAPFESDPIGTAVYAVLTLRRGDEFLGYLVVDFLAETLINDCFQSRIRSEFYFMVQDEEKILFRSAAETKLPEFTRAPVRASETFQIRNRKWQLTMVPKESRSSVFGLTANLSVLFLGVILSVGLSWLVYLLLRRMEMFRMARDQQALLSRKVLVAQEDERARVSRELHDELGQLLTALRLEMGWLEKRVSAAQEDESEVLQNTVQLVEQATAELRRMCRGLRPPLLDDLGLEPAVNLLVADIQGRSDMEISLDISLDEKKVFISKDVALSTYRIIQESTTNVSRHAEAMKLSVRLEAKPAELTLSVEDDGRGFDMENLGALQGWGLEGMQERANLVGGTIEIHSTRGQGTRVSFRVPLTAAEKEKS
jgi:signal transduction histidine kinase